MINIAGTVVPVPDYYKIMTPWLDITIKYITNMSIGVTFVCIVRILLFGIRNLNKNNLENFLLTKSIS